MCQILKYSFTLPLPRHPNKHLPSTFNFKCPIHFCKQCLIIVATAVTSAHGLEHSNTVPSAPSWSNNLWSSYRTELVKRHHLHERHIRFRIVGLATSCKLHLADFMIENGGSHTRLSGTATVS